jgi:hypothetical protein
MGVDARMKVHLKEPVNSEKLQELSYIFGSAFHCHLMIGMNQEIWHKPLDYNSDWDGSERNEMILNVPLSGRYYGPGYERGPIMDYIIIAEFLEMLIPNCEIYYGGDSSDELELFNTDARRKMMQYFIRNRGRDNYVRSFKIKNDSKSPICPVCKVEMVQSGWGHKYSYFSCMGCGWQHSERDEIIQFGFEIKEK